MKLLINSQEKLAEAIGAIQRTFAEKKYLTIQVKTGRDRTLIQNAKMWAALGDVSKQVDWPVNGVMQKLSSDDWKAIMTAAAKQEVRIAQGLNGGMVVLGISTRRMTIAEMGDVIECVHAFGAEHGVRWSDTSEGVIYE